ncbi:MAG: xanthan lyase, partial [Porphyromonadaceae bacterium CG2_30_38_12]
YSQRNLEKIISDSLTYIAARYANVGKVNVSSILANDKTNTLTIVANDALSYIPFRPENVTRIYSMLGNVCAKVYPDYAIACISDKKKIEDLIPNYFRQNKLDSTRLFSTNLSPTSPLVVNLSKPIIPTKGLKNKHLAVWQSHGLYYNQTQKKWLWQRAKLFQTVEDLYTQSYVLPFLVPMLENAGANVLLPRERDLQRTEIIVDNDNKSSDHRYREQVDVYPWEFGSNGFANLKLSYLQGENPFNMGTYRYAKSIANSNELSTCEWTPDIPEDGTYAVYVSFKTMSKSAPDARYSVFHKGTKTDFKVNQTMAGGTWVYLGSFGFEKGRNAQNKIVLSNYSSYTNRIITADAVKIGGGMGNIARNPTASATATTIPNADSIQTQALVASKILIPATTSNSPRYTEAARYWLQWAGMPDSVYSRTMGKNDYSDDFQSRGFWVNYLAAGSAILPYRVGLNIPIDLAFAFHSDAGTTLNDSIIGTLGICSLPNNGGKYVFENGNSRLASRDLVDIVQTQVTQDIRKTFAPEWTRRGLWDKSYSESRVPEVPTMLLEMLSHQNFADMRYGLDPRFRFTVSRAIYKGMLRYLYADTKDYIVQPLPVEKFNIQFVSKNKIQLRWEAVSDSLEPTAKADNFILYTRIENGNFDNGKLIENNKTTVEIQTGKIYSFKVSAVNRGGESFPSEILAACRTHSKQPDVLIINGFDRVAATASFAKNHSSGGFIYDDDAGVPYLIDYGFIGKQFDYDRSKGWKNDDDVGFGASFSNYADKVIVGNTFDYPYLHGKAIKVAGNSFTSCSLKSVVYNIVNLKNYRIVDLILGKQKKTWIGNAKKAPEFKTFPLALQSVLHQYCQGGGNLFVSGAYIGSDMYVDNYIPALEKLFMENTLKFKFKMANANFSSKVSMVGTPYPQFLHGMFNYYDRPNEKSIFVETVDAIEPTGIGAFTLCRYNGTNLSAGVIFKGNYKTCSLGFPFEVIQSEKERNKLMISILHFLEAK